VSKNNTGSLPLRGILPVNKQIAAVYASPSNTFILDKQAI